MEAGNPNAVLRAAFSQSGKEGERVKENRLKESLILHKIRRVSTTKDDYDQRLSDAPEKI